MSLMDGQHQQNKKNIKQASDNQVTRQDFDDAHSQSTINTMETLGGLQDLTHNSNIDNAKKHKIIFNALKHLGENLQHSSDESLNDLLNILKFMGEDTEQ